jgi:magnesium chelatase family protein
LDIGLNQYLNKLSTQKQKRICNNDFSQVVVLFLSHIYSLNFYLHINCSRPTVLPNMKIHSVHESGGKGVIVSAETSLSKGLPNMILVGFAGKSLDESRERIRSAFGASSTPLPRKRITVNISPSDLPKDGAHYDLAVALSILLEAKMIKNRSINPVVFGELGLDGSIKPVRGLLGKLLIAIKAGHKHFIIPEENLDQASLLGGINIYTVKDLKSVITDLASQDDTIFKENKETFDKSDVKEPHYIDFSEVIGQTRAKRALEIAAAGGHNALLNGPPGVGKSMLAKAIPGILSSPSKDEIITITHLHSLISDSVVDLITERPFRSPHHSSSDVSIIGGGQRPKPGEVSLANGGVLFLDELPEFRRSTIESLRQPLEDGVVTVARAKDTVTYPARFMMIATKNPCPCGFYGSTKSCSCSPIELQRYQKKLSGPILDRIDIHVTVDNVEHKNLLSSNSGEETSTIIKERVQAAQKLQHSRFGAKRLNSTMNNRDIKKYSKINTDAKEFIDIAAEKLGISARVYMKMIKISQTIADLENSDSIKKVHIAEALQYRPIIEE